ncbi:hypothetical protein [Oceanobacillus oncorhynchi]|uniref:hypothetical protein n=1 Tax=Oceanobacillus oncorhynchi TaxID=545501 RepID=UPI0025A4B19A|nr:hypothetical protein [Oceanobacillus oncorhynchi]MDM8098704.1 hypothetical protein [Oceanobacillus oncorhynchi]
MKKDLKSIVQEVSQETQIEFFDQETINAQLQSFKELDDKEYFNQILSFVINTSTSYSSTVLLEVLERMKDEGYFKVKR